MNHPGPAHGRSHSTPIFHRHGDEEQDEERNGLEHGNEAKAGDGCFEHEAWNYGVTMGAVWMSRTDLENWPESSDYFRME